ncbi:response regulator [Cohnella sp. JJ-181]|uniref:response regulator n=1 Tax=Cohnella rhizoplanae TaxID=2974897 RepID=UPI0022FFA229|nr:response regulator [Cohnella sp. JJ-181]CAI6083328.1 HTH-type transcriptional activator RhaS [Cohnella sp. JJ-181]
MKICVVDDERQVRMSILQKLNALFPDDEIFDAEFGHQALERIEMVRPDLAFLDIRMPEIGGLDILKRLKASYPAMHVVIISGYDDFEYARQALQYGASDYLLKPADRVQLKEIVDKVQGSLQTLLLQEVRQRIDAASIPLLAGCRIVPQDAGLWFDERQWKEIRFWPEEAESASPEDRPTGLLFTFALEDGTEGAVVGATVEPASGGFREKAAFLPSLLAEYRKRRARMFFHSRPTASDRGGRAGKEWTRRAVDCRERIVLHARGGDYAELELAFDEWLDSLGHLDYNALEHQCAYLMALLDEGLTKKEMLIVDEDLLRYWQQWVANHASWEALQQRLRRVVLGGVKAFQDVERQRTEREQPAGSWFQQALALIESSADMNVSLEAVAEAVNVHPVTLSRMFKQQMGENFVRYLTRKRLTHARDRLLRTHKKINEIAEETGYADHAYFRGLFKREFGYSPSEFRKQHGIDGVPEDHE